MDKLFRILFTSIFVFSISFGKIIKVPSEIETIQNAINISIDGDTVLVSPGIYSENINFRGKNILLTSNYIISSDISDIENTVIDGSQPINADTASCVLIVSGETRDAILNGFTLTGGTGTVWIDEHGAGTYTEGGGILITLSSPTIKNNIIKNNEATKTKRNVTSAGGGGIRCGDGSPLIVNNIIEGNKGLYGAGIVMNYASGVIKNNIIKNNDVVIKGATPSFGGGGIWVLAGGTTTIENNTIIGNSSQSLASSPAGTGGGILLWTTSANVNNNIIWGNIQSTGNQVKVIQASAVIEFNNVEDGNDGNGNISEDPLFVSGTYFLNDNSPCIDAGNPSTEFNDAEDLVNPGNPVWPAKGSLRNDMGAYGGPDLKIVEYYEATKIHSSDLPIDFMLKQNYPNPFNPSTTINYSIPKQHYVNLRVFDVLGREVDILVDKELQQGNYEVEYQASNLTTGTYFYRIEAGDYSVTKKMLLMK